LRANTSFRMVRVGMELLKKCCCGNLIYLLIDSIEQLSELMITD